MTAGQEAIDVLMKQDPMSICIWTALVGFSNISACAVVLLLLGIARCVMGDDLMVVMERQMKFSSTRTLSHLAREFQATKHFLSYKLLACDNRIIILMVKNDRDRLSGAACTNSNHIAAIYW